MPLAGLLVVYTVAAAASPVPTAGISAADQEDSDISKRVTEGPLTIT